MTLQVQRLSPVGGWIALVGAAILGPLSVNMAKTVGQELFRDNLTVAALGVFILWFGWFGFNPGSQLAASTEADAMAISHVFLTTNLAACRWLLCTGDELDEIWQTVFITDTEWCFGRFGRYHSRM